MPGRLDYVGIGWELYVDQADLRLLEISLSFASIVLRLRDVP